MCLQIIPYSVEQGTWYDILRVDANRYRRYGWLQMLLQAPGSVFWSSLLA